MFADYPRVVNRQPTNQRMKKTIKTALGLTALCALAFTPSAQALSRTYQIGSGSSVTANTGDGLKISTQLDSGLSGRTFILDDGASTSFKFFKIWTTETTVQDDDIVPKSITATLDFAMPDLEGSVPGSTVGTSVGFLGFYQAGKVTWNDPVTISALDRTFTIDLNDATFNEDDWWVGLNEGKCFGANITATITQTGSLTPQPQPTVPDGGSTAMLVGLGLVGMGLLHRKQM